MPTGILLRGNVRDRTVCVHNLLFSPLIPVVKWQLRTAITLSEVIDL